MSSFRSLISRKIRTCSEELKMDNYRHKPYEQADDWLPLYPLPCVHMVGSRDAKKTLQSQFRGILHHLNAWNRLLPAGLQVQYVF